MLHDWRLSTIDIDLRLEPEADDVLRAISVLKDELDTNVELASPLDFIPAPPDWTERSPFVAQEGRLTIRHLDPYAQALAKIERDHTLDREDVHSMLEAGLVTAVELRRHFEEMEGALYRFPAIDPRALRGRVERTLAEAKD